MLGEFQKKYADMTHLAYKPVISIDDTSLDIEGVERDEIPVLQKPLTPKIRKTRLTTVGSVAGTEREQTVQGSVEKESPLLARQKRSEKTSNAGQ
jgi:hypothetical protein